MGVAFAQTCVGNAHEGCFFPKVGKVFRAHIAHRRSQSASKLVQHVARANAYGQILLGLDRPAADVSRGSNAHDILGVAAIVGVQSVSYNELFPDAGQHLPGEYAH